MIALKQQWAYVMLGILAFIMEYSHYYIVIKTCSDCFSVIRQHITKWKCFFGHLQKLEFSFMVGAPFIKYLAFVLLFL